MKLRTLSATAMILLTPLAVLALQAQADQVRKGDLKSKPFTRDPLKLTLIEFYAGGLASPSGNINIEVENTSDGFTTFDPRRLSFIDKDDNQVDILGLIGRNGGREWVIAAEAKRIGPKARIKHFYALTGKVRLPARLYYEDKLLATIIE
jgi:hypothetical protein